jgi:hypothetical protein
MGIAPLTENSLGTSNPAYAPNDFLERLSEKSLEGS